MGHIKEPNCVDFEINSRELTKDEETAISEYIKKYKEKLSKSEKSKKRITKIMITKKKENIK